MTEIDDELLNASFASLVADVAGTVRPDGTAPIRARARRRRTIRAGALTTVTALAVAVPIAGYATRTGHTVDHGSASALPTNSPSSPGLPSPSPSPTASLSSSSTPNPTEATSASHLSPPDSVMSIAQLTAHPVDVPPWTSPEASGCQSGAVRLVQASGVNHVSSDAKIRVFRVVHANLEGDSALETAALISCQWGATAIDQVVGFRRDAGGQIITIGKIVEGVLWDVRPRADHGVFVDISDMQACCGTPVEFEIHQTRGYARSSGEFRQISGPTVFISHDSPTDLGLTVTNSTWQDAVNGTRTGTLSVTVTNSGSTDAGSIVVFDASGKAQGNSAIVANGPPAGASVDLQLTVTLPDTSTQSDAFVVKVYERGSELIGGDSNDSNNTAAYQIWPAS